jgi:RHS repeat-associated protein
LSFPKTSGGTVLTSLTYCYDLAGNRTNAQTTTGASCPGTATFTYDGANQLLTQPYGSHAAYDLVGNETDIDSAATGSNQRRQSDYSSTNQVQDFQIGTGSLLNQTYLGTNNTERLISNISTTDNQALLNTPLGISASTRSHSGTPQNPKYYTRDPNGNLISMRLGSTHYYYQTDNQQSVVKLLDDAGAVKDSYSYDPYGQPTANETVNQPFGYTSGWLDSYSGLLKLGARYYDPTLGRFTQTDPAAQGPNPYSYAGDDPTNFTDPTGRNLFGCAVSSFFLGISTIGVVGSLASEGPTAGASTVFLYASVIGFVGSLGEVVTQCGPLF